MPRELAETPCSLYGAIFIHGSPIEFYKAFSSKLSPILSSMYNEILSSQKLPKTLSVLLKKDKNPLDCGSYCPISLLCCIIKFSLKCSPAVETHDT